MEKLERMSTFPQYFSLPETNEANKRARCLIESATPGRLVIIQKTSPEGCCTYGSSIFAPVGRGTPDH
ncbi:hypothetical protein, partial [Bifidobacterium animalis]|uniref:hypothetical protein n=1 Tax=Bifidobacterium animalis TaxID=28025 RepID=UPI001EE7B5E7